MFLQVSVCPLGEWIPACLTGHMTNQQYISSSTVAGFQLVWRQLTGNNKMHDVIGHMAPPTPQQTPQADPTPWAGHPPTHTHTVNKREVRIPLECILVSNDFVSIS